jgi:hypothetical protein
MQPAATPTHVTRGEAKKKKKKNMNTVHCTAYSSTRYFYHTTFQPHNRGTMNKKKRKWNVSIQPSEKILTIHYHLHHRHTQRCNGSPCANITRSAINKMEEIYSRAPVDDHNTSLIIYEILLRVSF